MCPQFYLYEIKNLNDILGEQYYLIFSGNIVFPYMTYSTSVKARNLTSLHTINIPLPLRYNTLSYNNRLQVLTADIDPT